jgi:D-alanyl-D-alanine-carboxypeptidase/D-alanyl-D-alanine-endopeptidase
MMRKLGAIIAAPLLLLSTSSFANFSPEEEDAPAILIVAVRDNRQLILGLGKTGSGVTPQADSLIRINSLSKLFCAELLAQMADAGQLKLSDPLQRYAPAPHASGEAPTLLQLATHTSGLPRTIDIEPPQNAAPHTWPDKVTRWQWLDRTDIANKSGSNATYSNVAFDLLADALENASGISYDELLRERITSPLDMRDTTLTPNAAQCARFIGNADAGPCVSTGNNGGSGGLYSTASDMAKWMKHLLQTDGDSKHASIKLFENRQIPRNSLHEVSGLDLAGQADGIGFGWVHLAASKNAPEIIQKTGGGGGFVNYIALMPATRSGIFITIDKLDVPMLQKAALAVNQALVQMSIDED